MDYSIFKFNFRLLLHEIASRGVQMQCVENTDIVEATLNDHVEYLIDYTTTLTPLSYWAIWQDKFYTKQLLKKHQFSVCEGQVFASGDLNAALDYAVSQLGFPVVIKPTNGSNGDYVYANLSHEKDFTDAFTEFGRATLQRNILVEKHFEDAEDCRFFIMPGKDMAVARRMLPRVVGDGKATIQELVEAENFRRMNPRKNCLCEIYLKDREGKRALRDQGLSLNAVPKTGEVVNLRYHANVSWGGESENIRDLVHPSYFDLTKRIASLFPKAGFLSVDLLVRDIQSPASESSYVVSEFNWDPGFSLHLMPSKGEPHNVLKPLVDLLFPETAS